MSAVDRVARGLDQPAAQRGRQAVDHAQADAAQQYDGQLQPGIQRKRHVFDFLSDFGDQRLGRRVGVRALEDERRELCIFVLAGRRAPFQQRVAAIADLAPDGLRQGAGRGAAVQGAVRESVSSTINA